MSQKKKAESINIASNLMWRAISEAEEKVFRRNVTTRYIIKSISVKMKKLPDYSWKNLAIEMMRSVSTDILLYW
jgi:hypothetical protein